MNNGRAIIGSQFELDTMSSIERLPKKFLTGLYPYSMMQSSYVPVSEDKYPNALKVTTSTQEWCGHTFMQLRLDQSQYHLKRFSYFESEGDVDIKLEKGLLEDEIWSRIRLNPASLPVGEVDIIPNSFFLRLRHHEASVQKAKISLNKVSNSEYAKPMHLKYSIDYGYRDISIYFEPTFPYTILGWEETHLSGFDEPKSMTTKGFLKKSINSAYWQQHDNVDRALRKQLGLPEDR